MKGKERTRRKEKPAQPGDGNGPRRLFIIKTGLELASAWAAADAAGGIWRGLILFLAADLAWDALLYSAAGRRAPAAGKADIIKKAGERAFPLKYAYMFLISALVRILA